MGKSSLAISNVGSSTRRKPLGLKPQQPTSMKALKKTCGHEPTSAANKENGNNNIIFGRNTSFLKKDHVATSILEESAERLAIRRRVEEAVAAHRASRALELETSDKPVLNSTVDEPIEVSKLIKVEEVEIKIVEDDTKTEEKMEEVITDEKVSLPQASKGTSLVLQLLSFLVVVTVAVWACVRITVIEPVPVAISLHKFNPPVHNIPTPIQAIPQTISPPSAEDTLLSKAVESAVYTLDVSTLEAPITMEAVLEDEASLEAIECTATVEEDVDSVIDLDAPVIALYSPDSAPVAPLLAPPAGTVIVSTPVKLASGHVVASVRKLAAFLRPVKDFIRKLGTQANMVATKLRKWFKFV